MNLLDRWTIVCYTQGEADQAIYYIEALDSHNMVCYIVSNTNRRADMKYILIYSLLIFEEVSDHQVDQVFDSKRECLRNIPIVYQQAEKFDEVEIKSAQCKPAQ